MRAHNGSNAVAVQRARFFQARPRRIEIKTSKLIQNAAKRTAGHVTRTNQSASSFHNIESSAKMKEQLIIAVRG